MILVPYFWKDRGPNWSELSVFLCSGGRQMWSAEGTDKVITKMLKDNGFPVVSMKKEPGVIYAQIDHSKLKMDDFYSWTELDPDNSDEDCWRTFIIPKALWSCAIFKEHIIKSMNLPSISTTSTLFSLASATT